MEVEFADNQLKRCYQEHRRAVREWGQGVAEKYILLINVLYAAKQFDELYANRSLRLHPLKGNWAGEYAMTLQGPWRLILTQEAGGVVRVKEVTKHYGD